MAYRLIWRALIPVAVALGLAVAVVPAVQASSTPGWRIVKIIGVKAGVSEMTDVAASGASNAWAGGSTCPASCGIQTPAVQHWNGTSWKPFTLSVPDLAGSPASPVVATSSPTNTWMFVVNNADAQYAEQWNGTQSAVTTFPEGTAISAAAVLSSSDAWAFGTQTTGTAITSYAAQYNGTTWTQVSLPVIPAGVSAISASDIWVYGTLPATASSSPTYAVARWTGHAWYTRDLPNLHLATGYFLVPGNIAALSPDDVWVDGTLGKGMGVGDGVVLLNWNGSKWTSVKTGYPTSQFDSDLTQDGHGGLWVSGYSSMAEGYAGPYLYHYSDGNWTRQLAPTTKGDKPQMGGLSEIPGTRSVWGAGELLPGDGTSQGVLLKYGS
jgi:hypothetical protein